MVGFKAIFSTIPKLSYIDFIKFITSVSPFIQAYKYTF